MVFGCCCDAKHIDSKQLGLTDSKRTKKQNIKRKRNKWRMFSVANDVDENNKTQTWPCYRKQNNVCAMFVAFSFCVLDFSLLSPPNSVYFVVVENSTLKQPKTIVFDEHPWTEWNSSQCMLHRRPAHHPRCDRKRRATHSNSTSLPILAIARRYSLT